MLQPVPDVDYSNSAENDGTSHAQSSGPSVNSGEEGVIEIVGKVPETNESSTTSKK